MFVEINQAPIYVKTKGQGEPALLLHGVPDSAEIWNNTVEGIAEKYECFAPDLPGFLRSGIPEGYQFDLDQYADFVDELVTKLEIKTPLTLIVHDWGGIYGLLWACKYPEKVKRIVGGSFPFSHLYKWHEWATVWRTPVLGELSMLMMSWPVFHWEIKRGSKRLTKEQIRTQYVGRVTKLATRFTVLKMYRSANPPLFNHWASKLKTLSDQVPIDLIWGADDPYVPTHQARLMHPRSVRILPNCGHWVPEEAPEEYIDMVLNGPDVNESQLSKAVMDVPTKKPKAKKAKA